MWKYNVVDVFMALNFMNQANRLIALVIASSIIIRVT